MANNGNKLDLIGQRYCRLLVIERAENINGDTAWKCLCDCGNEKTVKTEYLRRKDNKSTKSCGCLNNEQRSARAENMYSKNIKYTPQEASAHKIWGRRYKEMPFEEFYELSQQNCYYCNRPPENMQNAAVGPKSSENIKQNGFFVYSGLDRRDNTLPHTKENCVTCCKHCNYAKRDRTIEEFKAWINDLNNCFMKK